MPAAGIQTIAMATDIATTISTQWRMNVRVEALIRSQPRSRPRRRQPRSPRPQIRYPRRGAVRGKVDVDRPDARDLGDLLGKSQGRAAAARRGHALGNMEQRYVPCRF